MVRQDDKSRLEAQLPERFPMVIDDRAALPVAATKNRQIQMRRVVIATAVLATIWWILNPADPLSWIIGGPTVALGTAAVLLLPPSGTQHISIAGLFRFAAYFLTQTVLGAIDVAFRAFDPWRNAQPSFVEWETDLPEGPALWMFANTITLLPGTLAAEIEGPCLTIHLLNRDLEPDLSHLEIRIRDLFALPRMETIR